MNIKSIKTIGKKAGLSFALGAAFLVAAGAVDSSSAFAQGLRRIDRDHDGRIDTRRELIEERKGFNAGLAKGRADAIAHRKFNPFIIHRGFVSNDYRQGFNKGYAQAYRQFAFNRGHHFGR
jgi:hypothetical protein